MLQFSTDDLRPHERFDHWCEVRSRNVFGVTIALDKEKRLDFHGSMTVRPLAGAAVAELHASPYHVHRTRDDIERLPSDSICLYQQTAGAGWFETARPGRRPQEFVLPAGGFATSNSDLPYATAPVTSEGFHLRLLKIPVAGDGLLAAASRDLVPEALAHPVAGLIAASFAMLTAPDADSADAGHGARDLAYLILLSRGRLTRRAPEASAALRAGYRHAAYRAIGKLFRQPDLSPAMVAGMLGVSVRQVHLLFEPTGTTFARRVTAERLKEAKRLLEANPSWPVVRIAYACGFDSSATFYRVFRDAYGMTPGDVRLAAGGMVRA